MTSINFLHMYKTYMEAFVNIYNTFPVYTTSFVYVVMLMYIVQLDATKYLLSSIRSTIHMYYIITI